MGNIFNWNWDSLCWFEYGIAIAIKMIKEISVILMSFGIILASLKNKSTAFILSVITIISVLLFVV